MQQINEIDELLSMGEPTQPAARVRNQANNWGWGQTDNSLEETEAALDLANARFNR